MKIRQGFVSNSSSASFIVNWKYEGITPPNIDESLNMLFYDIYDMENKKELCEKIKKQTVQKEDKTYETKFHTNMFNNMSDFGKDASCLVMELIGSDTFTLVNAKIEDDDGYVF